MNIPEKKTARTVWQVITALVLVLFIISFAVVFTLNFRPLYYFDIKHLDISGRSGYTEDEIRANYDVLIDYNSAFGPDTLEFPTLAMSEGGRIHFEEVKDIFVAVEILCIVTFIAGATAIIWHRRWGDWRFLKYASILTVAIPAVLALILCLNWEQSFVTFHHIFFNNDYWIFDAATDPVITILPDTFFFHCAMMILALAVAGSILSFVIYKILNKKVKS